MLITIIIVTIAMVTFGFIYKDRAMDVYIFARGGGQLHCIIFVIVRGMGVFTIRHILDDSPLQRHDSIVFAEEKILARNRMNAIAHDVFLLLLYTLKRMQITKKVIKHK